MKKPAHYNQDHNDRSFLIHEFLTLYKDFSETLSTYAGEKILNFLQDPKKIKSFVSHALFNPHPETHTNVEADIESTITAIKSWMSGKVDVEIPLLFIQDLKKWIVED